MLKQGVDCVVSTPGRLQEHLSKGNMNLDACSSLVLDEVDVLYGDAGTFEAQLSPLRAAAPESTKFVLVTATLPAHVFERLQGMFPGLTPAFGPGLHRTAAGAFRTRLFGE